jgi:hypothetical protein
MLSPRLEHPASFLWQPAAGVTILLMGERAVRTRSARTDEEILA